MQELINILNQHGIESSSLKILLQPHGAVIYHLVCHGSQALLLWQKLRALVDTTGYWPLILGESANVDVLLSRLQNGQGSPERIIAAGLEIDPEQWLAHMAELEANCLEEPQPPGEQDKSFEDKDSDDEEDEEEEGSLRGEWPENARPSRDFSLPFDLTTREPHPQVHLALLPTRIGWHAPAFLDFGGWNECPQPEEHAALLKRWNELYGAEIVGMTYDTIELQVARPPQDRERALELAIEQFLYCMDIVSQGVGTIDALAAILMGGTSWFFWWD